MLTGDSAAAQASRERSGGENEGARHLRLGCSRVLIAAHCLLLRVCVAARVVVCFIVVNLLLFGSTGCMGASAISL